MAEARDTWARRPRTLPRTWPKLHRERSDSNALSRLSEADREKLSRRASAQMCPKRMLPKRRERSAAIDQDAWSTATDTIASDRTTTRCSDDA